MKLFFLLFVLLLGSTLPALAQGSHPSTTQPAAQYLQALFDSTISAFKNRLPDRGNIVHQVLEKHFEMQETSKFVAGNSWRLADERARMSFVNSFSEFLTLTAIRGLEKQPDLTLQIRDVKQTQEGVMEIASSVILTNRIEIPVNWIVESTQNRYAIRDISFLGISMRIILRDFVASAISESGKDLGVYADTLKKIGAADLGGF